MLQPSIQKTLSLTLKLDLIPFKQFLECYSLLLKVYIYGYCVRTFEIFHLLILTYLKGADFQVRKLNRIS
jgi:hypothetical protein